MKGVQYMVNEKGEKQAVILSLKEYGSVWEDMYDVILAKSRADEPRISLQNFKKKLKVKGRIRG